MKVGMCCVCLLLSVVSLILSIVALNKNNKSTFADRNSASQGSKPGKASEDDFCFPMRPGSQGCDYQEYRCKDGLTCNSYGSHGGKCVKGKQSTYC